MIYEDIYNLLRGSGYLTRGQADELAAAIAKMDTFPMGAHEAFVKMWLEKKQKGSKDE